MAWGRRWFGLGKLRSDDGSTIYYGHRTVYYSDKRGTFSFGFEEGFLFPRPHQIAGEAIQLSFEELNQILERLLDAIRSDGHFVDIFKESRR